MDGEIIFNIDVMLAKRKMSVTELSEKVGITLANVSVLKNGKAKALKISTLIRLCEALDCQPGDILEYRKGYGNDSINYSITAHHGSCTAPDCPIPQEDC